MVFLSPHPKHCLSHASGGLAEVGCSWCQVALTLSHVQFFPSKNQVPWLMGEPTHLSFGLVGVFANFFLSQCSALLVSLHHRATAHFPKGVFFSLSFSVVFVILGLNPAGMVTPSRCSSLPSCFPTLILWRLKNELGKLYSQPGETA